MEFSRPEEWSRYPFLFPGDLPNPGIEPRSPALQVDSLPTKPQGNPIPDKSNVQKEASSGSAASKLKNHFLPCFAACGILFPKSGMEPAPPALEASSLNHWIARDESEK